jgi:hypothetical protein
MRPFYALYYFNGVLLFNKGSYKSDVQGVLTLAIRTDSRTSKAASDRYFGSVLQTSVSDRQGYSFQFQTQSCDHELLPSSGGNVE